MSIRQMNIRFTFGLSLLGLLLGTYVLVLRPGISSTLSWIGIFIILGSSLYLFITVRVLQTLSRRGWDKQSKWWAGFIPMSIYTLLGLGLMVVGLVEETPEMSMFYLFAGWAMISAATVGLKFGLLDAWTQ